MKCEIKLLLFLMIILLCFSCGNSRELTTKLTIEFDGFKREFHGKYDLVVNLKSKDSITTMLNMLDSSEHTLICNLRPVMWDIDVFSASEKGNLDLLFSINMNTEDEAYILRGKKCFKNDDLVDLIREIIHLNQIKNYQGELTQESYIEMLIQNQVN